MSKLEEIKGNYARSIGYDAWGNFLRDANRENILLAMNIIAKDYAKAKLEEAAERATIECYEYKNGHEINRGNFGQEIELEGYYYSTSKQSITETPLD